MEALSIQTTQNIDIEYIPASVGERIVAQIIDFAFIFAYSMMILLITTISGIHSAAIYIVGFLPALFYGLVMETTMNGQSWGKKIMNIKVVKKDGTEPAFTNYFIRWIFSLVDKLLFAGGIGALTIILNGKGQRLGDIAAGTTVIRLRSNAVLEETIHVELPEDYQVVFPDAAKLSDKDINVLKGILNFRKKNGLSSHTIKMFEKAKKAISAKLKIKTDIEAIPFIETIVRDYNFLYKNNSSPNNLF